MGDNPLELLLLFLRLRPLTVVTMEAAAAEAAGTWAVVVTTVLAVA